MVEVLCVQKEMFLILAAIAAFLIYYVLDFYRSIAKYPRGPTPLPFFGNLFQVERNVDTKDMYLTPQQFCSDFKRFRKEFGSVFTVFLPAPVVVLADYDAVREAFVTKGDDFVDRPSNAITQLISLIENGGVVNSNGAGWQAQRRASIGILRDFGMGKNLMEQQVLSSIEEYLRFLDGIEDKKHVNMRWPIQLMVSNIINETLFDFRYKFDDCDELVQFVELFNRMLERISRSRFTFFLIRFPLLKHFPLLGGNFYKTLERDRNALFAHIRASIARAKEGFNVAEDEPTCFVHAYAKKIAEQPGGDGFLTEEQLAVCCRDFFLAGQETTSSTLRWATLFLAAHQDVQERIRAEIRLVVGDARLPAMADRPHLPYTTAAVHEIQRCANIVAANFVIFRKAVADTRVQHHDIPAGAMVDGDLHQILATDPHFEQPEQFRPERYLADDGKTLRKDLVDRTVPFGLGRRQCAGEGLARVELFLGVAATLQRYRLLPPADGSGVDLAPRLLNNLHLPKPHVLQIERVF